MKKIIHSSMIFFSIVFVILLLVPQTFSGSRHNRSQKAIGLKWSRFLGYTSYNKAEKICKKMRMRIPTKKELILLSKQKLKWPVYGCSPRKACRYISSDKCSKYRSPTTGWDIYMVSVDSGGYAKCWGEYSSGRLRCVKKDRKSSWKRNKGSLLIEAISKGNLRQAKILLKENADINYKDKTGSTPLSAAISKKYFAFAIDLVRAGAKFQKGSSLLSLLSSTPLSRENGSDKQFKLIKMLIKSGVNVNSLNDRKSTALHRARSLEMVKFLIKEGANVNARDSYGRTPVFDRSLSITMIMVENGARVNVSDKYGNTPLLIASRTNQKDLISYLLQKGASARAVNKNGVSTVYMSCSDHRKLRGERFFILKNLVKYGAKINAKKKRGHSAFAECSRNRYVNLQTLKFLVKKGGEVNPKRTSSGSPLMFASMQEKFSNGSKKVKFLISKGANVNAKDSRGDRAIHYAINYSIENVRILIKNGANVNVKNKKGVTPLMMAAKGWYTKIVKLLVKSGADVNARDRRGRTIFRRQRRMPADMYEFLKSRGAKR
ncbi:ankyrin repeat domain-containing protein [Spirochaetota bacterium]